MKHRLLVIEDEPMLSEVLEMILTNAGFHVTLAATLGEAKRVLRTQRFDLVLSDCVLPDGLACELFDALLQTPTLVITGYVDAERLRAVAQHPSFVGLLPKPFEAKELLRRVKEVLECRDGSSLEESPSLSC